MELGSLFSHKTFHNFVKGFGEKQRTKFHLSLWTLITNSRYFSKFENFLIYFCSVNSALHAGRTIKTTTEQCALVSVESCCVTMDWRRHMPTIQEGASVFSVSLALTLCYCPHHMLRHWHWLYICHISATYALSCPCLPLVTGQANNGRGTDVTGKSSLVWILESPTNKRL